MKRDKFFYLWLLLLIVGMCCTLVLLCGRFWQESRDDRAASAVYYDDVLRLAQQSGHDADDWLGMFSQNGVRYVIFDAPPAEAEQKMLAGFDLSPAGYIGKDSAFGLPEHSWGSHQDIPLVLIENKSRTSVHYPEGFDLEHYDGPLVKGFYLFDEHVATYPIDDGGQDAENMLFRAVTERGLRLLLLRPFVDPEYEMVSDISLYADVLSGLGQRLEQRGVDYGDGFSCMETSALRPVLLWGSGCLTAALWVFLFTRPKCMRRWGVVLCLLAVVGMAAGCLFLPKLMQKMLMLLCAAGFPCVGIYGLWRWRQLPPGRQLADWQAYLLALLALLGWSLLGGFAVGALMSDRSYLMGEQIFSGVKAAQLFPLLCCLVLFAIPVVKEFFDGPITKKKVLPLLCAAGLLGIAGAVLILRSGDVNRVSSLETLFRNTLESALYARPRTKELLIAVPFMAVGFTAPGRKSSLLALIAGLCFCLESISVVNTFCHAVAPLHVSLIRSLLGAGLGALLGLVLLFLINGIFQGKLLIRPKNNRT